MILLLLLLLLYQIITYYYPNFNYLNMLYLFMQLIISYFKM